MNHLIVYISLILLESFLCESESIAQSNDSSKIHTQTTDTVFFPDWRHNDSAWVDWEIMPEFPGGEKGIVIHPK